MKLFTRLADRVLEAVVPAAEARAAGCWTVCCGSSCKWIKTCCSNGTSTWCYACYD